MDVVAKKECCLRILSLIMEIKYTMLDKAELEMHLLEINRLLTLLEEPLKTIKTPLITYSPDQKSAKVLGTELELKDGEVIVHKTPLHGIEEFLKEDEYGVICRKNLLQSTVEYIAQVSINEICFECLRRSSPYDLAPPLVVARWFMQTRGYHTQCYRKIYIPL